MGIKIYSTRFAELQRHRDLRCGLGLLEFQKVIDEFVDVCLPTTKLGKILTLEYGNGLTEDERSGDGYPVVGSNGVVGFHDEYLINGPCIVVGRKGSAGEITYLEENCYPIDTTFYVNLLTDQFDMKFLAYMLKRLRLQRLSLFKGVPGLNRYDAYEVKIPIVPMDIQIETLRRIEIIETEIDRLKKELEKKQSDRDSVIDAFVS